MTDAVRRRVLITGAGSGVGAATALALAPTHDLVLAGRRRERLDSVAADARRLGAAAAVRVHDVAHDDPDALVATLDRVDDLVLAAGLNTPRRRWADLAAAEFAEIVATNLTGVARMVASALPSLREAAGSVVVISSKAAWTTAPEAGVAYRASKAGLRSLVDSLNEQESARGVRACHLCPGEIDTEFLSLREVEPDADARRAALRPDDVARAVRFVLDSPPRVRIDELVLSPAGAA